MPSELSLSVKAAIKKFAALKTSDEHGEIAIDVFRSIRDEATLLMERQTICDTFDLDPLKFIDGDDKLRKQVERMKGLMNVKSCSRCSTKDGYSTIEAVVEISNDAHTKNVEESIRLTFNFQREKLNKESDGAYENDQDTEREPSRQMNKLLARKQNSPTCITYDIDFSKDHGERKSLITVEVYARNDYPSTLEAVPMDDILRVEGVEFDENGDKMEDVSRNCSTEEMSIASAPQDKSNRDRYAAYVDPESLQEFLIASDLKLDAENSLFFLMTFPFYEHEWDIFGFLLDCVFGADDGYEVMSDSSGKSD